MDIHSLFVFVRDHFMHLLGIVADKSVEITVGILLERAFRYRRQMKKSRKTLEE
jgi:hypothetical protein